ncbi:nitrilase-related carbon-nitrogen hydrolase [Stenotrophomonas pigmentata]|uniref:nitrilase-related carbon-nitrogen hydrolase n=1 Tax=Stenotrophomonas pigmentata TaxID=3055080 RepID=UPI0026F160C1|nr:nitrilase-related carbon-nitrogen hydrolase [Stenotrophomonas sp. 610A2]
MIDAYRALALQTTCRAINACATPADAAAAVADNIERVGRQIRASKAFIGADLKLVVLPEYFATSYPLGDTIPGWAAKGCFSMDGSEYEQLGRIAQDNGVYLCSNAYERDPNFPELYFQSSVILDDSGNQILRYRRLISLYAPSPHDVWDKYLDVYGIDGVFPVARTPLGRLSCIASEEILYPEIARAMGLRGAEVILHSTSEVGSPELTPKDIAKRARALENMAYVVSANTAGISGVDIPLGSADGMSKIVDDQGRVLSAAGTGESMAAYADLDIAGLRRRRLRPGMGNFLSRLPQGAINAGLASTALKPNALLDGESLKIPQRADFAARQKATLDALLSAGVLGND